MDSDVIVDGRYQLLDTIGEGGMGSVYRARHVVSEREVALKVIHARVAERDHALKRFRREASAASKVEHQGLVEVLDAGQDPESGMLYIAMELLKGEDFRAWLERSGTNVDKGLRILGEVLRPLAALHSVGLVHRDLKPANIFLHRKSGKVRVKLLDFGIARFDDGDNATESGVALGTPRYMAPEQITQAKNATAAADIWAVGVMIYELLAGFHPFEGATPQAILVNSCVKPHNPIRDSNPEVSTKLSAIVDQCLLKDPAKRIQDAMQLRAMLNSVLEADDGVNHQVTALAVVFSEFQLNQRATIELQDSALAALSDAVLNHGGFVHHKTPNHWVVRFAGLALGGEGADRALACAFASKQGFWTITHRTNEGNQPTNMSFGLATGNLPQTDLPSEEATAAFEALAEDALALAQKAERGEIFIARSTREVVHSQLAVDPAPTFEGEAEAGPPEAFSVSGIERPSPLRISLVEPVSGEHEWDGLPELPEDIARMLSGADDHGEGFIEPTDPALPVATVAAKTPEVMPSPVPVEQTSRRQDGDRWSMFFLGGIITVLVLVGLEVCGEGPTQEVSVTPAAELRGNVGADALPGTPIARDTSEVPAEGEAALDSSTSDVSLQRVQAEGWRYDVPVRWQVVDVPAAGALVSRVEADDEVRVSLSQEAFEGSLEDYLQLGDQGLARHARIVSAAMREVHGVQGQLREVVYRRGERRESLSFATVVQQRGFFLECRSSDLEAVRAACLQVIDSLRLTP